MLERQDPVNWSSLRYMRTSPKHYLWNLTHPREDTDALQRGRVLHCAVYEPGEFDKRYVIEPRFHRGMLDATARDKGYDGGKEAAREWDESVRTCGLEIIPADVYLAAKGCGQAVLMDPISGPMIVGGYAEQLVTWTDAETGIECRGRVDHVNGRLSDLKSILSIDPRIVNREIANRQYHAQIAFYEDGLAANGIVLEEPPADIFVEATPPHDVLVLEFSADDVAAGRSVYRRYLRTLAECRERGEFPGVAGGRRRRVALPSWAQEQEDVELTMGGVALAL